jgi:hypothetical protein
MSRNYISSLCFFLWGRAGGGTYCNGHKVHVSETDQVIPSSSVGVYNFCFSLFLFCCSFFCSYAHTHSVTQKMLVWAFFWKVGYLLYFRVYRNL